MLSSSFTSEEHQEDEELKCPKCLSFFSSTTKPYILPCNHNICLNCIDNLISENNTKCPLCNNLFNKKDRNSFEVNFGFLNLVIKILQTKIIFCTKCNKIFYWKDHYNSCEQKYFQNCNEILEDIKINYEEGEKILKIIKNGGDLLSKYKKELNNLVKNIINEIHIKYIENIEQKINNELFKTNLNIKFDKSKTEIINFMKLCLSYPEYFDIREINQVLEYISPYNSKLKNSCIFIKNRMNKNTFSPQNINLFYKTDNAFFDKNKYSININKNNNNKKLSTISCSKINKINSKETISEGDDDDSCIINHNCDEKRINESDRIKVKIYHDNNIAKFKKMNAGPYINNIQSKSGFIKRNILFNNQNNQIKKMKIKIGSIHRRNKFDINNLLDDDINLEEDNTQNKIIIGLKDVKVISLKNPLNNNIENNNSKLINPNYQLNGKKNNLNNINSLIINHEKKNDNNKNNINNNNNNKFLQKAKAETPSLGLLRSNEFTKREFKFGESQKEKNIFKNKIQSKLTRSIGFNYFSNTINVDHLIEDNLTKIDLNNNYKKIKINNSFNTINEEKKNIFSMNKIIKNFNKIRDITNTLINYTELINFLHTNISSDIEKNMYILKDIIMKNYVTLLDEISHNANHRQKNFVLTHINNTYNILIYNPFNKKYIIKNYIQIFKKHNININPFNNSISIVYDDNDLIFITGGENNYNLFIILTWSTCKIIHIENMQIKKAYHKTIYYNDKLYLIGGSNPNKETSSECFYFHLKEKKWHTMPNLNTPRKNASLCFYNNTLYVFRGEDDNNVLDTIEYYNIIDNKKKWNIFKPIDNGYVWYPAKNSLILNVEKDKIFICGGEDNEGNLFKDCFLFEPSTRSVYKGLDLVISGSFISEGCFYQNEIFGIDYKNITQNNNRIIHFYNTKKNSWKYSYIK